MRQYFTTENLKLMGSFIFFAIILPFTVIILTLMAANQRSLTALESGLLQFIGILGSISSSYYFAKKNSEKIVHDRAKLALRRVFTLYTFFPRFIQSVEARRKFLDKVTNRHGKIDKDYVDQALDSITTQAFEQIGTVNDAVDDWKDLVPDPEEVLEKYKEGEDD